MIRSLTPIAALVLLASTAGAGELPQRKAEPKRTTSTRACEAYGAGFVYVAGSNTCIKIGGSVRVETSKSLSR
jgi:hypothetical protein